MFFLKKMIREKKDEKFNKEYPFLILSPRVPMEEEIGISKDEVIACYNKIILGDLFDELKRLGFKQRGKTLTHYKYLDNGFVITISLHRNIKSFSIFSVVCGCVPLFVELERFENKYSSELSRIAGLGSYDFDCQNELAAKQSYSFIVEVIESKVMPWCNEMLIHDNIVNLFRKHKNTSTWDIILALLLKEGRLLEARKEIKLIKNDSFLTRDQKIFDLCIKSKLEYYEKLIESGKDVCISAMKEREEQNKKRFKIK